MRGTLVPIAVLVATAGLCIAAYRLFSRDYQYLQLIKLGDRLMQEGLPYQAARTYGSAVLTRPDKALGYLKRAEAQQRQGNLTLALEDLLKASDLSPDLMTLSLRLAEIYYARGQFDEAASHYTKILAFEPDSETVLYRLGLACFRAGREREAVQALDRAISVDEGFAAAYYLRGAIHRSLGKQPEAEADFLKALNLHPDTSEARSALIELYLDTREPDKALRLIREEIERQPQATMPYLHLADVHRLRGKHDEAIQAVSLALEQDPNLPQAYLRLGELWLQEGERRGERVALEKAVQALESAAKMDPANGRAALALGRACLAIGDHVRSLTELKRAAEATPIQPEAHRLLGDLYLGRRAYGEAVTAYHIYLKLKGEVPNGEVPKVLDRLGEAYLGIGNFETAAETFVQLAAVDSNPVTALVKAARAYLAAGRPKEAERACKQGLASDPQSSILQDLLARATGGSATSRGADRL